MDRAENRVGRGERGRMRPRTGSNRGNGVRRGRMGSDGVDNGIRRGGEWDQMGGEGYKKRASSFGPTLCSGAPKPPAFDKECGRVG